MNANPQRGGAMVELVFLMMAAAYVMHLMLFWNGKFSKSESYWAGAAFDAHAAVNHAVCLENISMKAENEVVLIKEPICDGL